MAELFGAVAGAASLLEIALKASKGLYSLQSQLKNAPDLIRALSNETQDLAVVLTRLDDTRRASEAAGLNTTQSAAVLETLEVQLRNARTILTDLELLTQELSAETRMKRVKWCLKKSRASELQCRLKGVRTTINDLLVAHTSSTTTRVQLELHDVRLELRQNQAELKQRLDAGSYIASGQTTLAQHYTSQGQAGILAGLQALPMSLSEHSSAHHQAVRDGSTSTNKAVARMESQLDQRFSTMSKLIADALAQPPAQGSMPRRDAGGAAQIPSSTYEPDFRPSPIPAMLHSALYISLALWGSRCASDCSCRCHMPTHRGLSWRLPGALQPVLGSLFVGYTGSPVSSSRCNVEKCSKGQHVRLAFTYVFPLWLLSYAIHGFVEASTTGPLTLGVVACRRVNNFISSNNLIYNAYEGQVDNVRRILRTNRASVLDVYYLDGRSALSMALSGDVPWGARLDIIRSLLVAGADPDLESDDGDTPRQRLTRLLLSGRSPPGRIPPEFGAELELMLPLSKGLDSLDLTFLHKIAAGVCDVDLAKTLQSRSRELLDQLDARDQAGWTPLMYAAWHGDVAKAQALVDAGAAIDEQSNGGSTPLLLAVANATEPGSGGLGVMDILLAARADASISNRFGWTALHTAAEYNNTDAIRKLVATGAEIDCRNHEGATPIHFAAGHDCDDAVQLLYELGADIDTADSDGDTPVIAASTHNRHKALSVLLRLGANHLAVDKYGATLLHTTARFGDQTTFEALASFQLKGISLDAEDYYGWTALECFEARSFVSDDWTSAFHRLLESVDPSSQTSEADCYDSDAEDQEFVDAPEFT